MNMIVAVDKNWGIGYQNELLISIPEDMRFFREKTMNKAVIMGKSTLNTFPGGKALKNRINIVITRNKNYKVMDAIMVYSIEESLDEDDNWMITEASETRVYCEVEYAFYRYERKK